MNQVGFRFFKIFLIVSHLIGSPMGHSSVPLKPLPPELLPTLPFEVEEAHFKKVSSQFEERWAKFSKDQRFARFDQKKSDEEIVQEYDLLDQKRREAWFVNPKAVTLISRPDFMIAQEVLGRGFYRNFNTIGFDYNKTDSSYNSSTLVLRNYHFLALEAPTKETLQTFMNLLVNHRVTHLIRLTPEKEGKNEMSAPYWNGRIETTPEKDQMIRLSQSTQGTGEDYKIPYFYMDQWLDNQGGNANELLELVLKVRKKTSPSSLIAVHCSSGVSRTGTFLAAFLLIDEIDEQLKEGRTAEQCELSAEKTVARLSLLRPYAIGKPQQYVTLYRLVGEYLKRQASLSKPTSNSSTK